jgi:hypothetical protein
MYAESASWMTMLALVHVGLLQRHATGGRWSVAGVIAVQGAALDMEYLRRAADALSVRDLLDRALADAAAR